MGYGTACPEGWQNYDQSCYKLIEQELSWDKASAYCVENSPHNYGHLATIHNDLENDFITYVVLRDGKTRWIGANDLKEEGKLEMYALQVVSKPRRAPGVPGVSGGS
ncbi:Snaclec 3 [Holothuria leucospilota]|uniref:Snaclec 3 n=1 Tax=Holothuria leucospilota TaxID=206669 RepID=A0A9Q1H7J6_HOLLE|nr:Snaclec 3 [Holothuria leucospilota]